MVYIYAFNVHQKQVQISLQACIFFTFKEMDILFN